MLIFCQKPQPLLALAVSQCILCRLSRNTAYVPLPQIEKEAQTWLDSDDEEGEKTTEETRMEEAPASVEPSEPQPGTSRDTAGEMERSPMDTRTEETEMEELQGAVGGSD